MRVKISWNKSGRKLMFSDKCYLFDRQNLGTAKYFKEQSGT